MINQETLTGMVLSVMPIGDYDKRLVILTKEKGKISAFARGARKPNCALLACSQPFTFGEFTVYQGRNSYTVTQANISNYFTEIREDLEAIYYGFYFCEFADYLTRENVVAADILKLLYISLRAVSKKTIPLELIRYIYELKILVLNGEAPEVFECLSCRQKKEFLYFKATKGGMVCKDCGEHEPGGIRVGTSTVYTMQYIITSSVEKLYTFTVSEDVLRELSICMKQYMEFFVDYQFKSLQLLQ